MNNGVAIIYGNVAPEAKENFMPTASDKKFETLEQLQRYNIDFPNYVNPCELYSTLLDGEGLPFPSNPETVNIGLISESITNDDGIFDEPIVLTLISENLYSSMGLTLTFNVENGIFSNKVKIKWIRSTVEEITVLSEKEYEPNEATYFFDNKVENYNKLVITFYSLNMPRNRLNLRVIDYGYGTYFRGNELRDVKLIQEISPLSTEISINTADFTLDSKKEVEYSFKERQPLEIYFNGKLKGVTFVKQAKRTAKKIYQVSSEDYIGLLEGVYYNGGIYNQAKAIDVLGDIFNVANIPFSIDEIFNDVLITGYIPYGTCRNALMQVAFAIQAVVDTSNSDIVKIYALSDDVTQTVPLNRIMQGQNFSDEERITGVEVTAHSYKPISEAADVYDAEESGIGENIFVKFTEPLHTLTIINGEIVESGANYAIINAFEGCILSGQKYEHTTQKKKKSTPLLFGTNIDKIIAIDSGTLVSKYNLDNIVEKCYNYYTRNTTISLKIVEGKHLISGGTVKYGNSKYGTVKYSGILPEKIVYDPPVNVGDVIKTETEYLGELQGRVLKQTFNLNGNIIVKDCTVR